ncbi:Sister chromatid cohesion protein 2, variant 2 [Entomophthora muscae]|nr:Sister chromatid cohesion protein 2, variant 2 [Entomophthora muscae]
MTDPTEPTESPRPNSAFPVDMRNWALNSIRSPVEVLEIIPDMSLIPESFLSYSSFFEADMSVLEKLGDDKDTLQGLADWLSGTDLNYLQLKEPEKVYIPELGVPQMPDKLPIIAQKVTNSCFQRFPNLKLQGVVKPALRSRNPQEIFDESSKPDPGYDLSAGFEDAVSKLLQQDFLPEPSTSNSADFEIQRPEIVPEPAKEAVRPKPNKTSQTSKELRNSQLNRFLSTVIDFADAMVPDRDNNPELDLVFFDGENKILSLITVVKAEKLIVKAIAENALELLSDDTLGDLFRLLQNTILYAETKSIFSSTPSDTRTPKEIESECLAVEAAVAAARLTLQLTNNLGTRFSKTLYNETLVTSSLNLVRHQLDHTILPALDVLAEVPQTFEDAKSQILLFVRNHQSRLCKLALGISGFAQEFGVFLKSNELAFNIIINLVFTCLTALFSELVRASKLAIFSPGASVNFKKQFQSVLQTIFVLYPEQRSLVVEEVINSLINLPADKRSHKSFRLLDGKCIHIATAIVLQLTQSCAELSICKPLVASPDYSRLQAENFSTVSESFPAVVELFISGCRAGLEDSNKVVSPVLQFLLTRASKGKGPNEAEYRQILDTMVEDSLEVLNLPEWPAAEIFLRGLCIRLFKIADDGNDIALKSLAIDYLGTIASRIKKHSAELLIASYEEFTSEMESSDLISSVLHLPDELGMDTSGLVLKSLWTCFERLARYLKAVSSEEPAYECARQFFFCDWGQYFAQPWANLVANAPEGKETRDFIKGCLSKIIKQSCSKETSDSLFVTEQLKVSNRGIACALNEAAACKSKLYKHFDPIMAMILKCTEATSLNHRARAVKALAVILKDCPDIISMEKVQKCMRLRLQDTSKAVRSAAVDFIGRCMTSQPELSQEYYSDICERILDTGVSIRQRVIKILKDISKTADSATLADIGCKILMRTQDSEVNVKVLAVTTLQSIWFSPLEGHELPSDCEALLKDSQQLRLESLPPVCQKQLMGRAQMIIDMVTALASSPANDQLISEFLSKSLERPPEPRSEAAVRHWSTCSVIGRLLIDCFFHHLILLNRDANKESICNTLRALVAFGTTGGLLVPAMHLTTLFPFINWSQDTLDQKNMFYAYKIYNFTLPRLENPNIQLLKRVETQIIATIARVAMPVLNESIPCLCHVAFIIDSRRDKAFKVYVSCLAKLKSNHEGPEQGEPAQNDALVVRLLVLLGLFGQNMDFSCIKSGSSKILLTDDRVNETYDCMFHFMGSKKIPIRAAAVQGLGHLCIAFPKLLLREELRASLLEALASDDKAVKSKLLGFLINYLNHDPTKLSIENIVSSQTPSDKQLSGSSDNLSDAGICSSIVQNLLPSIVECILTDEFEIQWQGLQFIGLVLEQGHINPVMCLPVLVALQTESTKSLSKLAGDIYNKLESKFPKLLYSRNAEVFQCVFNYHCRRGQKIPPKGYHPLLDSELPRALLHFMYSPIRALSSRRVEFFKSILNFFDIATKNDDTEPEFLKFLAENVSALEYQTPDEVHDLLTLVARAIVPGESALQHLEGNTANSQDMTEAKAVEVADATSLLLILKHSLQARYGLRNPKAFKEKVLASQPFNTIPWETFKFGQHSAHRLKVLFDRDLTFIRPDESLLTGAASKPRSAKKPKGPPKPSAKAELSSEDELMYNIENASEQESDESLEDMEP